MLVLAGVVKRYGAHAAVDGVDLTVGRGRTVALIGPSGCGKTTLLRMLVGLVEPDAGRVLVAGRPMHGEALELRRLMGYVIQDGGLFPHMTARENVALVPRWLGWDPDRVAGRVAELAVLTRFPEAALDRHPVELSGGQAQRVGLMRALVLDPGALLLDEPLAALDPLVRAELQRDLRAVFEELGKSVLLVTHDLAEAAFFSDDLVLMRGGRVVQRGSLTELERAPSESFVETFLSAQRQLRGGDGR